jgi:predicted metal-dependent TIM-barrel fold hydrolase
VQKYLAVLDKSKLTMPKLSHALEPLTRYLREEHLTAVGEISAEKDSL